MNHLKGWAFNIPEVLWLSLIGERSLGNGTSKKWPHFFPVQLTWPDVNQSRMFSLDFPSVWLKKAQSERCFCCCRHWLNPHHQCLWPFGSRQLKVTQSKIGESRPGHNYDSTWAAAFCTLCVYVYWGVRKLGVRGAHPGQKQVVRYWLPGSSVMFLPQVMAGSIGSRMLEIKFLYPLLYLSPEASFCFIPSWRSVQMPLCAWFKAQNLWWAFPTVVMPWSLLAWLLGTVFAELHPRDSKELVHGYRGQMHQATNYSQGREVWYTQDH